jgi:hypothetical protein
VVRDNFDGRLFPVGDVEQLTSIMAELISDFEQRNRLGAAARMLSQRFEVEGIYDCWDQQIEKAEKFAKAEQSCASH